MENLRSSSDSGYAVWTASLSGTADQKLSAAREHGRQRQTSQGLSSQSRSYQPSQLTLFTPTEDQAGATPQLLETTAENELPPPPTFTMSDNPATASSSSPMRAGRTNLYTVSSTATAAGLADPQQPARATEERRADGAPPPASVAAVAAPPAAEQHLAHSYPYSGSDAGEGRASRPTAPLSSTLPRPSKIPPAAMAAAAAVMHPFYTSHALSGDDGAAGGAEAEVRGERLEDYLDLQDDDDDDADVGGGHADDVGCPGHASFSNAGRSGSQQSQPSRSTARSAHWMNELYEMTGEVAPSGLSGAATTTLVSTHESREAETRMLAGSPCTPPAMETQSVRSSVQTSHSHSPSLGSGAPPTMEGRATYLKKVQPPPLSGFTPVVAVVAGSTPPDYKASSANNASHASVHHTHSVNHNDPRVWIQNATPQPLSLGSSSKVSPGSQPSSVGLQDEERRLREELHALRQRLADTEQRLAKVQRRIAVEGCPPPMTAESSMNGALPGSVAEAEAMMHPSSQPFVQQQQQQLPQQPQLPQTIVTYAADPRPLDPSQFVPTIMPGLANPHYTVSVPPLEMQHHQQQQQQHMAASSMASKMYMSSAPPSASVTMMRPASSDPSTLAGSGVTYLMQNGAPFGMYAMPSTGTLVDAAGNPVHPAGAMNALYAAAGPPTHASQAAASAAAGNASPVQMLGPQPYMMSNQPAMCYMVLAPQPPTQQQQQQQAASGVFSNPMPSSEFGSVNGNANGAAMHMKGHGMAHMPMLGAAAAAAGKLPDVLSSSPHLVMVGPASNGDLTRKCFNVHGSMAGVLQYFPYDEQAPPAPTATILTGAASPGASMLGQSMSGAGWSVRSVNGAAGGGAEVGLAGSTRSHDGLAANDVGVNGVGGGPRSAGASSSPNTTSPPSAPADLATAPTLPVFIQMFPCELHDRATVLNRLMEATCGKDFGIVQRIEPRSETSFIAHVRTHEVWQLIYKLRCRVLMDRFGFWYAADLEQYVRMKEYCEGVRRLPQQTRHFQTDGLPCMPLVVELSRAVDKTVVTDNNAPRTFDEVIPIAAVDRHRTRMHTAAAAAAVASANGVAMPPMNGGTIIGFSSAMPPSGMQTDGGVHNSNNFTTLLAGGPLPRGSMMAATASEMGYMHAGTSLSGSARVEQATYLDARPPPPPFHVQ